MFAIHRQIFMIAKSKVGDGFQGLSRCRYKGNHPDVETTDFGGFVQNSLHHHVEIKRVQNRPADLLQRLQHTRAVRPIICTKLMAIKSGWSAELTHRGSIPGEIPRISVSIDSSYRNSVNFSWA